MEIGYSRFLLNSIKVPETCPYKQPLLYYDLSVLAMPLWVEEAAGPNLGNLPLGAAFFL